MSENEKVFTPINDDRVIISNREIYDAVIVVQRDVAKIENKVEAALEGNTDLRKRVRGLELRFYAILAGLIGSMTMLLAGLGRGA